MDLKSFSFGHSTMRDVSFSDISISREEGGNAVLSVDFLAHDLLHGLYHYRFRISFSPTLPSTLTSGNSSSSTRDTSLLFGIPSNVEFSLLSFHNMARLIPLPRPTFTTNPTPIIPHPTPAVAIANPNLNLVERSETPTPISRSGFGPGSRGYVSASALGSQAKRGVWIERERSSVKRTVYAFEVDVEDEAGDEGDERGNNRYLCGDGGTNPLLGKRLHQVESYDLRGMSFPHYPYATSILTSTV